MTARSMRVGSRPAVTEWRGDVDFGVEVAVFDVEMWWWMLAEADPNDDAVEPTEFRHWWRLLDLVEGVRPGFSRLVPNRWCRDRFRGRRCFPTRWSDAAI